MKKWLAGSLVLLATAVVAQTGRPMKFEDMMAVRRVGAPQLSPDGKWIAYDVATIDFAANKRKSAVYLIPAAGGTPQLISEGKKQDENPVWSPDGKSLAFISNSSTDAKQIFLYDVAAKSSRKLTDLPNGAGSLLWSPAGNGLALVTDIQPDCGVEAKCTQERGDAEEKAVVKARVLDGLLYRHWNAWQPSTRSHILFQPLDGTAAKDLTPGRFDAPPFSLGGGDSFDISPDGKEMVYSTNVEGHAETSTNSDLYVVDLKGGTPRKISSAAGADDAPTYSPDGKWIAFKSQERAGYESDRWRLMLYNRASGAVTELAPQFADWVEELRWSPDSHSVVFTSNVEGRIGLYEASLPKATARKLYAVGAASSLRLSRDGRMIYFDRASLQRPNEIFAFDRRKMVARQLTHENDALFAGIAMGSISEMRWSGADGASVHGWMITPPNFNPAMKYPGIVLVHGGPQGAWEDAWSFRWNAEMFAARGYAVFMPNPRGSTGYGQPFVEGVSKDWGGKPFIDIMNGVDQFEKTPFVDPTRIGAAGASYGGYMIDWIMGHTDRFKALVSHDGVFNLESMAGATEELWFTDFEFGGDPYEHPDLYEKWSPHRFVKNFKTPTLVVHGELDYRVPIDQGMQLFTALQRRGIASKFLYFPDEGHWVLKPQNSQLWYSTVLGWMDQWLKK